MKTLHIIVANKIATYSTRGGDIVCGNSDYQIEFNFDTEWDAYERKTARFIWNGKYKDVVFMGTVCPVPIVANTNRLEVGVYAEELSTTTSAVINCLRSIRCNSDVKSEGTVIIPGALLIEVPTEAGMTALLTSGNVNSVYKYTGTTGTYENGALYLLEATDEPDTPEPDPDPEPEPEPEPDTPDTPDEPEQNTFTFTVSDETYTADNGMTWYGWAHSNYCNETSSCESEESKVYIRTKTLILDLDGNAVIGREPITKGGKYLSIIEKTEDLLAGTWVFDDTVTLSPLTSDTEFKINFTYGADDTEGTAIQILGGDDVEVDYEHYDDDEGEDVFNTVYYGPNGWYTDKTIHITTKLDDLTYDVGNSLLAWLEANATKQ